MINISNKSECCGCEACINICPKCCISYEEDTEGFSYKVDVSTCIDCHLCEKVCPIQTKASESEVPKSVWAAKNLNEDERMSSSSGGVFIELCKNIIRKGGVVFGARFDEKWNVIHDCATTLDEARIFKRSKYVQSHIGNTFKQAKKNLESGKIVLYCGTPCEIAGLKSFLRKPYHNLITIDFVCHGVPSPGIWTKYLAEEKQRISDRFTLGTSVTPNKHSKDIHISSISFREKERYSWEKYGFTIRGHIASTSDKEQILFSEYSGSNPYLRSFSTNHILRPSCYTCKFKDGRSGADITLGDFWGITKCLPQFNDRKGVSLIMIHTSVGEKILGELNLSLKKSTYEDATRINKSYLIPSPIPPTRQLYFDTLLETGSVYKTTQTIIPPYKPMTTIQYMVTLPYKVIKKLLRLVKH